MKNVDESLLDAWLSLSTTAENIRVTAGLTHNEMLVCYVLFRQIERDPEKKLTPTEIAARTKIRKSQVNRNLNKLEDKGIITREHSKIDRRRVFVRMNLDQAQMFHDEYKNLLELVNQVIDLLGAERCEQIVEDITRVVALAEYSFPMDPE
ncbi:MarR family winged helix-turn-helix transcriptional regulator [Olsenella urininfantis]|uniref:MarR family winged helix-turn-helix transcriptional regulator n=1 Tax=Olsenella urininfantis TaxID=1871033 RepID=UPI0013563B64|nr:MarR family winged helix-turn-helix transcriptional regulator [Olsenella urininfantis]